MGAQDIMFGRAVRFTCDYGSCEARCTSTGEPPDGWQMFDQMRRLWACPKHVDDAEFDQLCDELS